MDSLGAKSKKLKVLDSCPSFLYIFLLLNQSSDHQPVFPAAGNLHLSTKPSNSAHSLFSVSSLSFSASLSLLEVNQVIETQVVESQFTE